MTLDTANISGLIACVADGWPQDWETLEATARDERTRHALKTLRIIAAIATFHQGQTDTDTCWSSRPENRAMGHARAARGASIVSQWGRFRVIKKIGEGAYGVVYKAHDTQLDREVALKLLKPSAALSDLQRRLLDEARMLAQLRHPNVAAVYGVGEHAGQAGLWMELICGITLEEQLLARGAMSAAEAALVGQDLCRALAAVHGVGLLHRDVKTANVMRELGGRTVLMDFGVGSYRRRRERKLAGTPHYVAPEVCAGSPATGLSDIYSLGVLLFRLVTGAYPRKVESFGDLLGPQGRAPHISLRDLRPDLPEPFVSAVEQALAHDPAERPQSAGGLRAALSSVLGVPAS